MHAPAPVAVPVEIVALDDGDRMTRAWRLTRSIGDRGIVLDRDAPFEAGRPVRVTFSLPDDDQPLAAIGRVREDREGRGRLIELTSIHTPDRQRIAAYVQERMLTP